MKRNKMVYVTKKSSILYVLLILILELQLLPRTRSQANSWNSF